MNKLNGWQRLGIVLSALWLAIIGIECWVELVRGPFSTGWLTDTITVKTGEPIAALKDNEFRDLVPVEQVVSRQRLFTSVYRSGYFVMGARLFMGLGSPWFSEVGERQVKSARPTYLCVSGTSGSRSALLEASRFRNAIGPFTGQLG